MSKIISRLLIIFALISLGFSIGKHYQYQISMKKTHQLSMKKNNHNKALKIRNLSQSRPELIEHVDVLYLHSNKRCKSCNAIETMAKEVVFSKYSKQIESGFFNWSVQNFQKREDLAKKFGLHASCVVLAFKSYGEYTIFSRLDKVWLLLGKPDEFKQYIEKSIDGFIENIGVEKGK